MDSNKDTHAQGKQGHWKR